MALSTERAKWVIEPQFDLAESFADGRATVKEGGSYGYIDANGSRVIPSNLRDAWSFFRIPGRGQTG